ncbi:hypothetical protein BHM03_00005248 [Ensete ventricosum]|nr:hypothetical protein BHM03_00005248 [Ensete ventricosum]
MVGTRSWFGGFLYGIGNKQQGRGEKTLDYTFNPLQETRFQKLKERLKVPFDECRRDHQEALIALWHASFPEVKLTGIRSGQWKDMGWQGSNPSTDFRGCGFVLFENLLFFATTYLASFQRLLFKQEGMRATWAHPFAVGRHLCLIHVDSDARTAFSKTQIFTSDQFSESSIRRRRSIQHPLLHSVSDDGCPVACHGCA